MENNSNWQDVQQKKFENRLPEKYHLMFQYVEYLNFIKDHKFEKINATDNKIIDRIVAIYASRLVGKLTFDKIKESLLSSETYIKYVNAFICSECKTNLHFDLDDDHDLVICLLRNNKFDRRIKLNEIKFESYYQNCTDAVIQNI